MNLKPSENTRLFGMSFYFNEIIKLYNQELMPNKILLSGKKGLGKSTLSYHLINHFLSENEEFKYNSNKFIIDKENRSFKLLQNKSHPNFYSIDISSICFLLSSIDWVVSGVNSISCMLPDSTSVNMQCILPLSS